MSGNKKIGNHVKQTKPPVEILLELSGSWEDSRDAEEIIADLQRSRRNVSERKIIQITGTAHKH